MKKITVIFILLILLSGMAIGGEREAAKAYLDSIVREMDSSISEWKIWKNGEWTDYRIGSGFKEQRIRLRSNFELRRVYSGVNVENSPVFLELKLVGRGLIEGKVLLDGNSVGVFRIDGADGNYKDKTITVSLGKNIPGIHELSIEAVNKGFKPPRGEFWPPRNTPLPEEGIYFSLRSAKILYETAHNVSLKVMDWIDSMKVSCILLNPELVKRTFTGKPFRIEDRRKISRKRLSRLNRIWARAVMSFSLDALKAGDTKRLIASIENSYKMSRELSRFARTFKIFMLGNAHIDIAWLWRIAETREVARNTYATVLKNMDEYPELIYAQSQAITYEWMEKYYPDIFHEIKRRVKEGRWEIVGGMWLEPDCNLISGESWVRQILYGKRYFRKKFGVDVKIGWNIDSFGYNWNMPQIYKKSGIDYFITQKILWNDTTVFPYNIFWWQGVDGTRILSYFPPVGYTSRLDLIRTTRALSTYHANTAYRKALILYGLGDHGGGPNREILNRVRHYKSLRIAPEFVPSTAMGFLKNVEKDLGSKIPTWKDELYLEYHRGTYTTHSEIKKNNRKSEIMLSVAEKLASIAHELGKLYPSDRFLEAWKLVMTNQFHDILPGSGITPIYRDAMEFYRRARRILGRIQKDSLSFITSRIYTRVKGVPVVVFNPLSWKRTDYVKFKLPEEMKGKNYRVMGPEGKEIPCEILKMDDGIYMGFIARDVPPVGYRVYSIVKGKASAINTDLKAKGYTLENAYYRIVINPGTGNIKSLYDKRLKREFIAPGKEGNVLQVYEDRPERWDAWNIGYTGRMWELNKPDEVKLIHFSPVRAVIRVKKSFLGLSKDRYSPTEDFPSSFFEQDITLYAGVDRIDVKMKADWWETHMFLKVAFPVAVHGDNAAYEIPFATIERTTKMDTLWEKARFEVPAHKWGDLSDDRGGISLLNNSKYGYDIHGNVMKLSLLRAPLWPDPTADRGKHCFVYSLYTHPGKWNKAHTVQRGYELNTPMVVTVTDSHDGEFPKEYSFFTVSNSGVILDTVKKAEDDDSIVLRLYEAHGIPEEVSIRIFRKPVKVWETNLMEENPVVVPFSGKTIKLRFKKFEIKTLKIKF